MGLKAVSNSQFFSSLIASWIPGRLTYVFASTAIAAVGLYFAKDFRNDLLDRVCLWITSKYDPQALQFLQEAKQTSDERKIEEAFQLNISNEVRAQLWDYKAQLALSRNDYNQAIEAAGQALNFTQKNDLRTSIYYKRAQASEHLGRIHEAIEDIDRGLELALYHQKNLKAQMHIMAAKIYQRVGINAEFILRTEKALFCNPSDPIKAEVWLLKGQALKDRGELQNSLIFLQKASRFDLPLNHSIGVEITEAIREVTRTINARKELALSRKQSRKIPTS